MRSFPARDALARGRARILSLILAAVSVVLFPMQSPAAGPAHVIAGQQPAGKIRLQVGKSIIIRSGSPVVRTTLGTTEVADIVALSPTQVYVTGKMPGITNLMLWQSEDKISAVYDLEVTPDTSRLKERIREILPQEQDIQVVASHDSLTLSGTVSSTSNLSRVTALAEAYGGDKKVVNLLQVSGVHQVMLEVRVAEMSRTLTNRLSINSIVSHDGSVGAVFPGNLITLDKFVGSNTGAGLEFEFAPTINSLFHIIGGNFTWTAFIDALKQDGLVKVLAEPTLIAQSGQSASFLAGGEFPIPVPQGLGTVAIEYKKFGVGLTFTPIVLGDDRINLKVEPEVSDLDFSTAVNLSGVSVPGITTRRVSTTIELADGQSFAIAGLLRDSVRSNVSKFPLLGEIPILGALFRSTSYQRNETELIVIVTPHLAKPLDMARQTLPTDSYRDPSDAEFYLLGLLQAREKKQAPPMPVSAPPVRRGGFDGEFGHSIP